MKKRITKILCFVLSLVMMLSTTSVAFAKVDVTPVILVHGVGGSPVYENVGTEDESEIKNFGLGEISDLLSNTDLLSEALKLLSTDRKVDVDKLCNAFAAVVGNSPFNADENGNIKAGQGINKNWNNSLAKHKDYWQNAEVSEEALARQLCKTQGAKNVYCFNYDWRQDICKTAKDLRKYVVNVKKRTGAKKVALVGCSLGGSVLSAYMDAYKNKKDIARYLFVDPAMCGVDVTRMYAMDIKITKKQVLRYLNGMQGANPGSGQETIFLLVKALGDVRVGIAAKNVSKLLKNKKNVKKIMLRVVKPWIGNIPALWECIPYDSYNKAVKEMSKIGFLDKKSGLYTKIQRYHKVQGRFYKNVKAVRKMGVPVAIVANYGEPGIPVTSKANNHIDGLIDTYHSSAGATVADFGKKLKKKHGKYLSGDRVIDASTCLLPNSTWFIRDLQHMQFRRDTEATKFIARLACGKVKYNLKAVKKKYGYGQFLKADGDQNLKNV